MFKAHFGEFVALFTAVCWTVSAGSFETAGKKVGSLSVNLIRLVMAFFFITIFNFFSSGTALPIDVPGSAWFWLIVSGIVGFVLGDLFLFQAYVEVGARISMLIMSTVPPITALTGYLLLGERITIVDLFGMLITIGGIALVILTKNSGEKKVQLSRPLKGLTFAFLGSCGQAFGMVLSKFGMGAYDPFAATQIRIIAGIIGFMIVFTVSKQWRAFFSALKNSYAMKFISLGSFFGPFLGVSLSLLAIQHAPTGVVSTITSITPIIIIPISIFLFKEKVTPREVLGAMISLIGVAMLFL